MVDGRGGARVFVLFCDCGLLSDCVRGSQPLEVDHVQHLSAMGGGNFEDISTHSVCSNTPAAVAEADAGTQIESMVAIECTPSDDRTILEQEDHRYMLLYSKSKAS
jgi:hypothetical protein